MFVLFAVVNSVVCVVVFITKMLFFQVETAEGAGSVLPLRRSSSAVRNLSGELEAGDVERSENLVQV